MSNKKLMWYNVRMARECQHMRMLNKRLGQWWPAAREGARRDEYMKAARQLKADACH